jgi:hypothetical protein
MLSLFRCKDPKTKIGNDNLISVEKRRKEKKFGRLQRT